MPKRAHYLILITVFLMETAVWIETDIFVPSLPNMVAFFKTTEEKIQWVLSLNFLGLFLAGLICGPLSDTYGRKKILLGGLFIFSLSSIGASFCNNFEVMLLYRFLQGIGASAPMVLSFTILLDSYNSKEAIKLMGWLNSFITGVMAAAPILGAWLNNHFNWRANFILVAILAFFTTICMLFSNETLPQERRTKLNIKNVAGDYFILLKNFTYMGNVLIVVLAYSGIMIYISNIPLIFINHLQVNQETFGYYQASTMGAYMVFSAIGAKLVDFKGLIYTKNLSSFLGMLGSTLLIIVAIFIPKQVYLICISMGIFASAVAMGAGVFGMRAIEVYPEIKGTSSSLFTATRLIIVAAMTSLSGAYFTGTIFPVSFIIFLNSLISLIIYIILERKIKLQLR